LAEANKEIVDNHKPVTTDRVILFGDGGTGKSFSIASTLVNAPENRRIIYLMTEPNAAGGLERGLTHYGVIPEPGQLIYAFPKRKDKGFANLKRAVTAYSKETKSSALQGKADTNMGKENYSYLQSILDSFDS